MDNLEQIKLKIKALLAKNIDNGATEAEAKAALRKASELMEKYLIDKSQLQDPYLGENCISKSVPAVRSNYDLHLFLGGLSQLFDTICHYGKFNVTFFGFEEDVDLCCYFYTLITRTALNEVKGFKKTETYRENLKFMHGRSLVSGFLKGFQMGIIITCDELYKERESKFKGGLDLVLYDKNKKVRFQFDDLDMKLRNQKINKNSFRGEKDSWELGYSVGKSITLTQGLNGGIVDESKWLS